MLFSYLTSVFLYGTINKILLTFKLMTSHVRLVTNRGGDADNFGLGNTPEKRTERYGE